MSASPAREKQVVISWRVTFEDRKEFGEITKTNRVPSGALNNSWRRLAFCEFKSELEGSMAVLRRNG